jgi:N-acetyl-gamma-glutamylphosphate reductase
LSPGRQFGESSSRIGTTLSSAAPDLVVIVGRHGKVALRLSRLLSQRADVAIGLIRNPAHADEVAAAGAEAVEFDLESGGSAELSRHLEGADAVVFAAGAGQVAESSARTQWIVPGPGC